MHGYTKIPSDGKPQTREAEAWLCMQCRERLEPQGSRQHYWCAAGGEEKSRQARKASSAMALGVIYRSSGSSSSASKAATRRHTFSGGLPANACLVRAASRGNRTQARCRKPWLGARKSVTIRGRKKRLHPCLCFKFGWMSQNIGASYQCATRLIEPRLRLYRA